MIENTTILSAEDVCYCKDNKYILDSVSLKFKNNSLYVIKGQSGAGKTSLLMLLNGLCSPTAGKIVYQGTDISLLDMPTYRSKVVLQFQEPLLFNGSGKDNLLLPFKFKKNIEKYPSEDALVDILELCALKSKHLEKDISTLSGGEKQRLSLARSLLLRPNVLLLDEPTSALDKDTEREIVSTIAKTSETSIVICVTHSDILSCEAQDTYTLLSGKLMEGL